MAAAQDKPPQVVAADGDDDGDEEDEPQQNGGKDTTSTAAAAGAAAAKKKKKKKKKAAAAAAPAAPTSTGAAASAAPAAASASSAVVANDPAEDKETRTSREELVEALYGGRKRKGDVDPANAEFKFWKTQPVPALTDQPQDHGEIETKTVDQVRDTPYPLQDGFEWSDCDIDDDKQLDEVYNLLSGNYVEDDDSMFRFDYSRPFLKWALQPPGFLKSLHVGVRVKKTGGLGKLMGFITGIPVEVQVYDHHRPMVEINFLCVHKKLRSKRLAPLLIKEITRRVNCTNRWQAVYTAGVVLPKPVTRTRYYHRSLNPKKLVDIGFSRLNPRLTMNSMIKLYKVPNSPQTKGIRPMVPSDAKQACALLMGYLKKFKLYQHYNEEEFAHWFMPREDVVYSYVVEDDNKQLTDMISFYSLPSSVLNNPKYSQLKAAYSFYNVNTKTPLKDLMTDALVYARMAGFDVLNALNVMDNEEFLADLKFGVGDGNLQYYLFNWRCPEMLAKDVGLVLL